MRDLLDRAIGEAPPTRIDLDRLIARQRRRVLLRAGTASGFGLGLAVLVAAAAVALIPAGRTGPAGRASLPVPGATPAPGVPAAPAAPPAHEPRSLVETAFQLAYVTSANLRHLLPEVQVTDIASRYPGVRFDPDAAGHAGAYRAAVRLDTAGGAGTLRIVVATTPVTPAQVAGATAALPVDAIERAARGQCPEPVLVRCSVTVGPQGQVVVRGTVGPVPAPSWPGGSGVGLSYEVVVVAWQGCYAYAELADGFAGWDGRDGPVPLAAPQLALGQLVDLVSVPDLTLG